MRESREIDGDRLGVGEGQPQAHDNQQRRKEDGPEDIDVAPRIEREVAAGQGQIAAQTLGRVAMRELVQNNRRQHRDRPIDKHVFDGIDAEQGRSPRYADPGPLTVTGELHDHGIEEPHRRTDDAADADRQSKFPSRQR